MRNALKTLSLTAAAAGCVLHAAGQAGDGCVNPVGGGEFVTVQFGTPRYVNGGSGWRLRAQRCVELTDCNRTCWSPSGFVRGTSCVNDEYFLLTGDYFSCQPSVLRIASCVNGATGGDIYRLFGPSPGGANACREQREEAIRRLIRNRKKTASIGVRGRGVDAQPLFAFALSPGETGAWSRLGTDPLGFLVDGPTGTGSTLVGTSTGEFTILNGSEADEGTYVFSVSENGGPFIPAWEVRAFYARDLPNITHAPRSQEACEGSTTSFRVEASNAHGYQWTWNGNVLEDGILPSSGGADVLVAGATTGELTLIGVTPEAAGELVCDVFGPGGDNSRDAETFPFLLDVSTNTVAPSIVTEPPAITIVQAGGDAEIVLEAMPATPDAFVSYQWRKDGTPIFGDGRVFGTNFPNLLIENVELSDAGVYDCVVTQACGTVTSMPAVLTVSCPADTNGDGQVSPADFTAWVLAYNSQSPACDQNGDELCTPADFTAWVLNFNAGC